MSKSNSIYLSLRY